MAEENDGLLPARLLPRNADPRLLPAVAEFIFGRLPSSRITCLSVYKEFFRWMDERDIQFADLRAAYRLLSGMASAKTG